MVCVKADCSRVLASEREYYVYIYVSESSEVPTRRRPNRSKAHMRMDERTNTVNTDHRNGTYTPMPNATYTYARAYSIHTILTQCSLSHSRHPLLCVRQPEASSATADQCATTTPPHKPATESQGEPASQPKPVPEDPRQYYCSNHLRI